MFVAERQAYGEYRSGNAIVAVARSYLASVKVYKCTTKVQPNASAFLSYFPCALALVETFKEPVGFFLFQSNAIVGYFNDAILSVAIDDDGYLSVVGSVFEGV